MNKKAKLTTGVLSTAILFIILLTVLFEFYSDTLPVTQSAGDSMNNTNRCNAGGFAWNGTSDRCEISAANVTEVGSEVYGSIPLGNLFSGTGIVFFIIMVALLVLVLKTALSRVGK